MYQRVLVAVDRSPEMAQRVLAEALAVAQGSQAQVNIVQVLYPLKSTYPSPRYSSLDSSLTTVTLPNLDQYMEAWDEIRGQSQAMLEAYGREARSLGLEVTATQLIGEAGREICRYAEDWNADLVVLGRRGLRGLEKLMLGSVSGYVVHRAHCAVLVVQGD